jgi:HK97 family phage portal protein
MGILSFLRGLSPLTMGSSWGSELVTLSSPTLDEETQALFGRSAATARTYTLPSVKEALGVPSIHRAVALIASTTGMLSVQGYQNGALMTNQPRLIARPDPYSTPYAFYAGTAAQMAKYGEFVWWIAKRDGDGGASALQLVPLFELTVRANNANRLRPQYEWRSLDGASVVGGRWTPATPDGVFVHQIYPLGEPYDLRGQGPLQLCNVAASVSVEAQSWAAQFFADGGDPSVIIKHAGFLSPDEDENGDNEAERLRSQWIDRPHNVPRIIDQNIESVDYKAPNPQGAQMLEARQHQKGDAAEMFGIPGSLLEYQQPGSSLTYQNVEGEFTKLVKVCLQPLYLEPIEQTMSDLLTRSTVAKFNVKGFLRADIKTRFEVYGIAIDKGIFGPDYAQREEGILPGDVEFSPVPYSPPQAVPDRIASLTTSEVRCDGKVLKRQYGISTLTICDKLLTRDGRPYIGTCPRCKKVSPPISTPSSPRLLA